MLGLLLAGLLVPQGGRAAVSFRLIAPASGPLPEVRVRGLEVRAISSRGDPVGGLEVILEREGEAPDSSATIREADRFAERTDSFGNALFFLPPGEALRLRAPKIPGYAPLAPRTVPEGARRIDLVLKSGPRIAGARARRGR